MPTAAERAGDFSASTRVLFDPQTAQPFENNRIPAGRLDPAARALLAYLPLPIRTLRRRTTITSLRSPARTTISTSGSSIHLARLASQGSGKAGKARRPCGRGPRSRRRRTHASQSQRGCQLPPVDERARHLVSDARRDDQGFRLGCAREPVVSRRANAQPVARLLQPESVRRDEPVCLRHRRCRQCGRRRRGHRSVRLGRADAVVHHVCRRARSKSVAANRSTRSDQPHGNAPVAAAHIPLRRRLSEISGSTVRPIRTHEAVLSSRDSTRRARAEDVRCRGPVSTSPTTSSAWRSRHPCSTVPAGSNSDRTPGTSSSRTTGASAAISPSMQVSDTVRRAVHRGERSPGQPRRGRGVHGRCPGHERRHGSVQRRLSRFARPGRP